MKTATVVSQPHGQMVYLPDDFRLDGDAVFFQRMAMVRW